MTPPRRYLLAEIVCDATIHKGNFRKLQTFARAEDYLRDPMEPCGLCGTRHREHQGERMANGWNDSCVHLIKGPKLRRVIEGRRALIMDNPRLELKPGRPTVTSTGPDVGGRDGGPERFHYGTAKMTRADDSEWRWAPVCKCGDRVAAVERRMQRALAELAESPGQVEDIGRVEGLACLRISDAVARGWDESKRADTVPLSELDEDTEATGVTVELLRLRVSLTLLRRALEHV